MKFKAYEIMAINETLTALADENLSLKTAITIAEDLEAFNTANTVIEKKRTDLIKEYAKKDENGEMIQPSEGQVALADPEVFSQKMNEMMETEIDVNVKTFKLEELSSITVTPRQALSLKKLFVEEKKEDNKEETIVE